MTNDILELRRKRAGLIQKAQHVLDLAGQESRAMTEQEVRDHDSFVAEIENLGNDIERREKLARLAGEQTPEPDKRATTPDDPNIGMSDREVEQYSLVRAINAMGKARRGEPDAWRGAELEMEASQAV